MVLALEFQIMTLTYIQKKTVELHAYELNVK